MERNFLYLDPEQILDSDDFKIIESFLKETNRTEIGWHYIVDLTWIYSQVKNWPKTYHVLDAGGGHGPTQFILAELGFNVTNIDLVVGIPRYSYFKRYGTKITKLDSHIETPYTTHLHGVRKYRAFARYLYTETTESKMFRNIVSTLYKNRHDNWRLKHNLSDSSIGKISWLNGNLCHLPEIADDSYDAVVSLSSLEHIPLDQFSLALTEIKRILKPDARYAVTTSATDKTNTWFHEASKGLCFSQSDLEKFFEAKYSGDVEAKYILDKYQNSLYLKENLANFYRRSGKNGMPWGKWEPKYIPVGIY